MESLNDLTARYNKGTVIIHWVSAILILVLFLSGKYMSGIEPDDKMNIIKTHAGLGMLIFILTIVRSFLFFKSPKPEHIKTGNKWNDILAVTIQRGFYFILILASIFGMLAMIQGGYLDAIKNNSPSYIIVDKEIGVLRVHIILATLIIIMAVAHIIGVFRHIIRTGEKIIQRISMK